MKKIKIIALFGQAGSGKDYLFNKVIHWDEEGVLPPIFNKIIKTTTRPKRENEEDGIDYNFVSQELFFKRNQNNYLSGVSVYRGWYYGIDISAVDEDKPNIVILDIQQIKDLMKYDNIDLTLFKIAAAPKTRLLRQLNREQNPDVNEIVRRFEADKEEYMKIDFDYIELQNETLEDADKAILETMSAGVAAAMERPV